MQKINIPVVKPVVLHSRSAWCTRNL